MEEKQMIRQTKFGWVDLSNLPKNNGKIVWKDTIGCCVPFKYKDVCSRMIINDFVGKQRVKVCVPDYVDNYIITTSNILNGKLGSVAGYYSSNFKHQVEDIIQGNMLITSCYINNNHKFYTYQCLRDGYVGHMSESDVTRGSKCPVCAKHKILTGYNDIATLRPDIADLLCDKNNAFLYGIFSRNKVDFYCPNCGAIINNSIENVCRQGLSCKKCSDGLSFPAKFVYNFLEQLDIKESFYTEKVFEWSKNIQHTNKNLCGEKRYDFYIPLNAPIIIEAHGKQHYQPTGFHCCTKSKSFYDELENDKLKMELAINNNILASHYIQLDCQDSSMNYIKNSIMTTSLPKLLCFEEGDIDWDECNRFATSSRVYEACEMWNNSVLTRQEIANKMKMHRTTINRYIKKGKELGIVSR